MTMLHKTAAGKVAGSLTYVLSDATLDRMGDIIEPDGWKLSRFRKNPIALFGHQTSFPIGTWKSVRVEDGKLIGELAPAAQGTSARVDEIISLIEQGVLRATSVGFQALKTEPINPKDPYGGVRFLEQELLETSIVSVPANPAAIQLAKSLNISDETMSLAFGEHAVTRRDLAPTGGQADPTTADLTRSRAGLQPLPKAKSMTTRTLAQLIEDGQNELNAKRDRHQELGLTDSPDVEAMEALDAEIIDLERTLIARKAVEARNGLNATSAGTGVASPSVNRRPLGFPQRDVKPLDLLVRAAVVNGCAWFGGKSVQQVLDERYPGHEATAAFVTKADQTLGTTTGSHWVDDLQQTSYTALVDALRGRRIWPDLVDGSMSLSFDSFGTAYIPSLTAGGANGGFFAEGAPMRVGRITTASTTMTPRKMGVIIPFSREAAKRSTPALEPLVRRAIVDDTGKVLDQAVIDATAGDTVRPAGLLNGVTATASGFGGSDYQAVIEDINALMAPFDTADASDGTIALIMHPAQARRLAMMPGPDGNFGWADRFMSEFKVLRSTYATAGRLIAVRLSDLITVSGMPEFEVSNQATIHMEDTTPLEIVSGTGPTTADPVRSFFQTDSMGVRMVMDVSWKMARTGMVRWIDTTTW